MPLSVFETYFVYTALLWVDCFLTATDEQS